MCSGRPRIAAHHWRKVGGRHQAFLSASGRNQPCQHLERGLPASLTVSEYTVFLLLYASSSMVICPSGPRKGPPCLKGFVCAAPATEPEIEWIGCPRGHMPPRRFVSLARSAEERAVEVSFAPELRENVPSTLPSAPWLMQLACQDGRAVQTLCEPLGSLSLVSANLGGDPQPCKLK